MGLTDASLMVLARRRRCRDPLTLDERRSSVLHPDRAYALGILPADA